MKTAFNTISRSAAAGILSALFLTGCGNPDRKSMQQAVRAFESGKHEDVIAHLQKVINRKSEGVPLDRAYNLLGLSYWQIGNVDQAIEAFQLSKRANPDYFESAYNLGVIYCEQDEVDKGAVLLEEAALIDLKDTRALEFLAASYQDRGQIDKAHEKLKDAVKRRKTPRNLTALAITGNNVAGSAYAIQRLEEALAIDKRYAPALYTAGSISALQNKSEEATNYFEKFLQNEPDGSRARSVRDSLKQIQAKAPKAPRVDPEIPKNPIVGTGDPVKPRLDPVTEQIRILLDNARSEVKAGADKKALTLCLMAAQEAKRSNKLPEEERALRTATSLVPHSSAAHFGYARFLNEQGRSKDAVNAYKEALKIRPGWPEALNGLAVAAIQGSDFQEALEALKESVKANPENPDSLWALGLFYDTQLQLSGRAKESFEQFIQKFPNDSRISNAKSRLEKLSQDTTTSSGTTPALRHEFVSVAPVASDVERAVERAKATPAIPTPPRLPTLSTPTPTARPSLMARRQFNQAVDAEEAGNSAKALDLYTRASELDPDFAAPHYNRGIVHHRQGDLDQARAAYLRALELQPNLTNARYHLGLVYHNQNEALKAEKALKRVLNENPDHGSSHYVLGMLYANDPVRRSEARRHYMRFVSLSPEHPAVPGVKQWLISN